MRRYAALLSWAVAQAAAAGDLPAIHAIEFRGNAVTRPETLRREMVVREGDPADPAAIERSRQGIQDLGLFKSVTVEPQPVGDGVKLVFTVVERWYLLPTPRFDANTEGETAYGATLRWYNLSGRNDTLRANYTEHQLDEVNRDSSTTYGMSYTQPFVFQSAYGFTAGFGHSRSPITDFGGYVETVDSANLGITRSFTRRPASQGWHLGAGAAWSRQDTEGAAAPPPYGQATALTLGADFRDVRDLIYSDRGITYGFNAAVATEGVASDYAYTSARARYAQFFALGTTPHQSLHLRAAVNSYHGGPTGHRSAAGAFTLGGPDGLRGYPGDFAIGDFSYLVAVEYARPVYVNWLRAVAVTEAGNAFEDAGRASFDKVYASFGVGLRVRVTFLVNVELEAGIAWPLVDRGSPRAFASKL